eukprot:g31624.t1
MLAEHIRQRAKRGTMLEEKSALRTLAKNRSKIAKARLLEISDAELVLSELKLDSKNILDCDTLAEKILARICDPPCPSWAGPSVLICVQRDQAPDVHIKYASHAHLDLLFDIYCRRIQVDSSLVSFKLRNRELQEDDTYESLRMGDNLWEPFSWSIAEHGLADKASSLQLHNFGFPFVWHRLDVASAGKITSEQLYGAGETTFEHQLGFFRQSIRNQEPPDAKETHRTILSRNAFSPLTLQESSFLLTIQIIDRILEASGSGMLKTR